MIINCDNCNKNFLIDSSLIPEKGRLLQCNACNHKWFFKKEIIERSVPIIQIKDLGDKPTLIKEDVTKVEVETPKTIELLDRTAEDIPAIEKISIQKNNETEEIISEDKMQNIEISSNKKSYNILGLTIVFIISFIAIIIVLDTFQSPISIFVPNIESVLYNLYETINDIVLFFNDLI
tara:strand:- start:94 stop:627 length:534 start_codon:yes stop_codon:yes gene_type:complete